MSLKSLSTELCDDDLRLSSLGTRQDVKKNKTQNLTFIANITTQYNNIYVIIYQVVEKSH